MATHKCDSQIALILNHMKTIGEIAPLEALSRYGCYRLGAIILRLKKEGYAIATRIEYFDKPSGRKGHYAVYRLEESENA